jgi:hypothetical protein
MQLSPYIKCLLAAASAAPILFLITGCASVGGRTPVRVATCVIPPPYVNKLGELAVDGAECTFADGLEGSLKFIMMPKWVCHPESDYWKVLESRK